MSGPRKYQDEIQRLGFESFADNLFMNMIEDHYIEGEGAVTIENDTFTLVMTWDHQTIHLTLRCHTSEGWKETSRQAKVKEDSSR